MTENDRKQHTCCRSCVPLDARNSHCWLKKIKWSYAHRPTFKYFTIEQGSKAIVLSYAHRPIFKCFNIEQGSNAIVLSYAHRPIFKYLNIEQGSNAIVWVTHPGFNKTRSFNTKKTQTSKQSSYNTLFLKTWEKKLICI